MAATARNPWDEYAEEYARWVDRREEAGVADDPILVRLLECLGDLAEREVLDAACGNGFLARLLTARGARVTAVDVAPRLIEQARERDAAGVIDFRVADLSRPVPELTGRFERIGSYMALNDIADLPGFAATVASLLAPGGRTALAFNNPYSSVVRGHVTDYFDAAARGTYGGFAAAGVMASYYHRPLEVYVDAFLAAGLRLAKLADVPDRAGLPWLLPPDRRFPRFMVLVFDRV
jgi:SAM-dependent methyltransferase